VTIRNFICPPIVIRPVALLGDKEKEIHGWYESLLCTSGTSPPEAAASGYATSNSTLSGCYVTPVTVERGRMSTD